MARNLVYVLPSKSCMRPPIAIGIGSPGGGGGSTVVLDASDPAPMLIGECSPPIV